MNNARFTTKMEHEKSRIVAEVFHSLTDDMSDTVISDLGRFGYGVFDIFSNGTFDGTYFFQDASQMLDNLCDSFRTNWKLQYFRTHDLNRFDFELADSVIDSADFKMIDDRIQNIRSIIYGKWRELEWKLMGEMVSMAHSILLENTSVDILFSSRFGYYYSYFRPGKDGWKIQDVTDYIESPQDMLHYISLIWSWNEYQSQKYRRFIEDIDDEVGIIQVLNGVLPEVERVRFNSRLQAAMEPFEKLVSDYYGYL